MRIAASQQGSPLCERTRGICGAARRLPAPVATRNFPLSIQEKKNMHIVTNMGPLAALIAGILILAVPRLLNYIVALYLIIIGLLGLFGDHIR
jgi:hypothetical protein